MAPAFATWCSSRSNSSSHMMWYPNPWTPSLRTKHLLVFLYWVLVTQTLPFHSPNPRDSSCFLYLLISESLVQSLSCVWLFETPWTVAHQASLFLTISMSLPKLMSIESVMPSNHFIFCRPFLLPPSIPPSIRVFSNELALLIRWTKYWSFSFSISPSNEYSGLISFRIDWFDLLAVQGTFKSLQHHNSKASILQHSAFFIVQLSQETEI